MGRATREIWAKRIERWQASGLTAREFGAEAGLNAGTLAYWKYRLGAERRREMAVSRGGVAARNAAFVEVVAPTETGRAEIISAPTGRTTDDGGAIEVVLGSGVRIRVRPTFTVETLRRVMTALGGS